jgi:hypothetical protein
MLEGLVHITRIRHRRRFLLWLLRELRGEVRENVGQVEDLYRAKDNPCCEPSRCPFLSSSATPILIRPEELGVDLLRLYQVFQLLEACKRPVFKDVFRHVNPLEQIIELSCSASCVPSASERRQMLADLLERHAVTSIVLAGSSKTHTAIRKHFAHDLCNLADAIVLRSIANIEYFIMNRFGGRLQRRDNCTRNVQPMD